MDQDNQKNLLLAIVLSVGVLLAWQMFYAGPKLKEDQERRQRIQQEQGQLKEQPGRDTLWRAEKEAPLTPTSPVTLVWDNGQGLVFRRTIAVDADYLFTVTDEVENTTGQSVALHPYSLISLHGMPKTEGYYILHE